MKGKRPSVYESDMEWCARHLAVEGVRVWCVRRRLSGIVLRFIAATFEEMAAVEQMEGEPVAELRVHPMYVGIDEKVHFGPECVWPREAGADARAIDGNLGVPRKGA